MNEAVQEATEEYVWSLIDAMDWNLDRDYVRVKRWCLDNLNKEIVSIVRTQVYALMNEINNRAGDHVDGCGDDSWSDVRAHIIGCGKEAYYTVMSNSVENCQKIIDDGDYEESFLYGLPYDNDWSFLEEAPSKATEYLKVYAQELNEIDSKFGLRLQLIAGGDFTGAAKSFTAAEYRSWPSSDYSVPNLINEVSQRI